MFLFSWIDINNDLLDWLKEAGEKGSAFIEREAPLLAQEIVAWQFWSSSAFCAVLAVAFLVIAYFGLLAAKSAYKLDESGKDPGAPLAGFVFCFVMGLLLFGGSVKCGLDAAKTVVAPRVVILEHITGAVGK